MFLHVCLSVYMCASWGGPVGGVYCFIFVCAYLLCIYTYKLLYICCLLVMLDPCHLFVVCLN